MIGCEIVIQDGEWGKERPRESPKLATLVRRKGEITQPGCLANPMALMRGKRETSTADGAQHRLVQ